MDSLLVVLDLDHTLVYCPNIDEPEVDRCFDFTLEDGDPAYVRPYALELINSIRFNPKMSMAVFTSAGIDVARQYLCALGINESELAVVLSYNDCTQLFTGGGWSSNSEVRKDLNKIARNTGHPIERIVAIDDRPEVYWRNKENVLPVMPYLGMDNDAGIRDVYRYLLYIEKLNDVRNIDIKQLNKSAESESNFYQ